MRWLVYPLTAVLGSLIGVFVPQASAYAACWWWPCYPYDYQVFGEWVRRWKPFFSDLPGLLSKLSDAVLPSAYDNMIASVGALGDNVNAHQLDLHIRRSARAMEPSPKACTDPTVAAAMRDVMQHTQYSTRENVYAGDVAAHRMTSRDVANRRLNRIQGERYTPGALPNVAASSAAPLAIPYGSANAEDVRMLIKRLIGEADNLALNTETDAKTAAEIPNETLRAQHLARLSVVRHTLVKAEIRRARRKETYDTLKTGADQNDLAILDDLATPEGLSLMDVLQYEIARTYGSSQFKNQVDSYTDALPVTKALTGLTATQNLLRRELNDLSEERGLLLGLLTLLKIEDNAGKLDTAFTAAGRSGEPL
ncbi:MAG: hypothetical protein CVV05_01060 [Gammaproteobacteria bacterium HGW-Gammaproteobacteria-1]|jgi:hypothetical protein|nr:MAG: hypothetical protein CVV05_01060 [Gammaproteobacteria bacterium HGW-Gammaproteobacteria-1]